jgi:hypothetical protein
MVSIGVRAAEVHEPGFDSPYFYGIFAVMGDEARLLFALELLGQQHGSKVLLHNAERIVRA